MNMTYITDPNEVEALVGSIKMFFTDAAEKQCVDIGWAVELLTTAVQLVDPNYTPPEPEEPLSVFCGVDTTNTNWDLVLNQAILTAQVSLHHEQPTTTESAGVPAKEQVWPS